ncbi:SCO family protein [Paenibacillus daejeonensis]|uniref:SCO family protein n=1 Tax=Paenibacillus daejeonensis TaxID=135193 RepID=UPI00036D65F9|nr:SCO family protein [Paenibacillus daejeonensis]
MNVLKRHGFKIAILALCALMAGYLYWSTAEESKLPALSAAPDYELTDLDGNTVTLEDTNGKVRLYYFYFSYCPDVCPPTTAQLIQVQNEMIDQGHYGDDFMINSITIDPERDTPERIREFAEKFGAIDFSGWDFLRGDEAYTAELAKSYGVSVFKDPNGDFTHTNFFILVDREGQVRKYIRADEQLTVESIIEDVEKVLKD